MPEIGFLTTTSPEELYLISSYGGRVLQVSPALTSLVGVDHVGRALTDVFEDRVVAKLITGVGQGDILEFDCAIGRVSFSCGARLSESGHIVVVMTQAIPIRLDDGNNELVRYFGREVNIGIENMNIAVNSLVNAGVEIPDNIAGLFERNMFNLMRISRNSVTKIDFEQECVPFMLKRGDVFAAISNICLRARDFCGVFADIEYIGPSEGLICLFDETALKRMILNLVGHHIANSGVATPGVLIKAEKSGDNLAVIISPKAETGEKRAPRAEQPYANDFELDVASILARKLRGSIIVTQAKDDNKSFRFSMPILIEHEEESFSNFDIDWYGGMDMVAVELAWVMPSELYGRARGAKNQY